jgi:hypothetical protein
MGIGAKAMSKLKGYVTYQSLGASATTASARSVSDDGTYPEFCARASTDAGKFNRFRSDPKYQVILEHLTVEQGKQIFLHLESVGSPYLSLEHLTRVAENETVGKPPALLKVGQVELSPTTLRYLKVASDINTHFDITQIQSVAEIGVGYGGQIRVLDALGIGHSYVMFDLDPVLKLTARYLECFVLNGRYDLTTLNRAKSLEPDLVLSMYALSELPRPLQIKYLEKVLKRSKRGFLIMNDCWDFDRLSRDEWAEALQADIQPEVPETASGNYILLWGHS